MAKIFGVQEDEQGNELFSLCYGGRHITFLSSMESFCVRLFTGEILCMNIRRDAVVDNVKCEGGVCYYAEYLELWELPRTVLLFLGFQEIPGAE